MNQLHELPNFDNALKERDAFKGKNIKMICITMFSLCCVAMVINLIIGHPVRILMTCLFILITIIPLIFLYFDKLILARNSLLIGGLTAVLTHSLTYAGGMDMEYLCLLIPIGALMMMEEDTFVRIWLLVSFLVFVFIKSLPLFYEPIIEIENTFYIEVLVGLAIFSLMYFIVQRYRDETLKTKNKLEHVLKNLKKTNRSLMESEIRYKAMFENAFDGIVLVDLETRKVVSYNQRILQFLEVEAEQVRDVDVGEYLTKEGIIDLEKNLEIVKKEGKVKHNARIITKNGQELYAEVSGYVLPETNNKLSVAIFKNITKEIKAKQKMVQVNQELKNFAHAASHDLKEPLRMIQSFGQLLGKRNEEVLNEESKEFLSYIIQSSKRMNQLVDDLLEYSTTEPSEVESKPVDLNNILQIVLNNLTLKIRDSKAVISFEELPIVNGNVTHLTQLFQNIIANGLKFQKPNFPPEICISLKTDVNKHIFCIKDNGIGMEDKYKDQIFGVFKRLHSKVEYEGSGIGLATCKKIVEQNGGKIWVESTQGQGSAFYFSWKKSKS